MAHIDDRVIGRHIQTARERKHLTQEKLATILDVTTSYISRIECGRSRVNLERLAELSCCLEVPVADLLEGSFDAPLLPAPTERNADPHRERLLRQYDAASPRNRALMCQLCDAVCNTFEH